MSKARERECDVYLEPIAHKYHHRKTGKIYKSVTTAIKLIEPEFDEDGVAEAISHQLDNLKQERYIGLSKQEILDLWHEINAEANRYGTLVHTIVEEYLKRNKWWYPDTNNEEGIFQQKVIDGYNSLKVDEGIKTHPECVLFSEEHELAGTSDMIIDINEEMFDTADWKTNRIFNYFNPYGFECLKPPFNHLQNCQWSIYTIQLSVYALMYEIETGKKCRHIWIGYWDKITETFSRIPIMYLKKEALQLMQIHHYNLLKV